ncbi:MAG: helix-turn-helix domain-containing protein [Gaiellaceae bacterium MAG52_C11]|nr:helix-turn-helix domain-containing protein [Candidatus Gaiellasilicea maunaloa]
MTSGMLIREARLLAGISQGDLGDRVGRDRAQIARWERDAVQPSFETLRELLRACGYDLTLQLARHEPDEHANEQIRKRLRRTPQERTRSMLRTLDR